MRVTGFGAILAALAAASILALVGLPAHATSGATAAEPAPAAPPPVAAAIPGPVPMLDVPEDELSADLRPTEPPPPDFTAAQYIDSAGCVFVRVPGNLWRARIARDGSEICGYPPTFSARRTAPDALVPLFPVPQEPRAVQIERALTETILPSLQHGELVAEKSSGEPSSNADARQAGDLRHATPASLASAAAPPTEAVPAVDRATLPDPLAFSAAVGTVPALRRQMASGTPSGQLCALLGGTVSDENRDRGGRLALGLCDDAGAPVTLRRVEAPVAASSGLQAPSVLASPNAVTKAETVVGKIATRADSNSTTKKMTKTASDARRSKTREASAPARLRSKPASGEMMIPAGARYVQIGAFRNAANADRAARRLSGLGLPVSRARGKTQLIMVGPLDGREAVVRAIDAVRRAGYRDAFARR